jgi:hypothetical protein
MPLPLYPQGKSPWYPLDRKLGEPQSQSGHSGVEKNSQPLSGLEPSIIQLVAQCYTTELSRCVPKSFLTNILYVSPLFKMHVQPGIILI